MLRQSTVFKIFILALVLIAQSVLANMIATTAWQQTIRSTFGGNGTGWTIRDNGVPTTAITSDVLTLTDNLGNQVRCAWLNTKIYISNGFTAQFTYTASGNIAADGSAFVIQNSSNGTSSLGAAGGSLGYNGITNSFAIEFNIYSNATGGVGYKYATNGIVGGYTSTTPVSFSSGNPIKTNLSYLISTGVLKITFTDMNTLQSFSASKSSVNSNTILGGPSAWVGFCGATGGSTSTQKFSSFSITTF